MESISDTIWRASYRDKIVEIEKARRKTNLWIAIIISASLVISSLIYAFANRYESAFEGKMVLDKWNKTIQEVEIIR